MITEMIIEKLAIGMVAQKENIIKDAITHAIGDDKWEMTDVAGRGHLRTLPDKTEIFSFDGVDLVALWPMKTEIGYDGTEPQMKAVQEFRLLYSQPED